MLPEGIRNNIFVILINITKIINNYLKTIFKGCVHSTVVVECEIFVGVVVEGERERQNELLEIWVHALFIVRHVGTPGIHHDRTIRRDILKSAANNQPI